MKKIIVRICVVLSIILSGTPHNAQVVFEKEAQPKIYSSKTAFIPIVEMPELNESQLKEDTDPTIFPRPFTFGHLHEVDLTLENAGGWNLLPNGDRIWQLKIYAPNAHTINLNYGKFDLPIGGKLYVYNESKEDILGPFIHKNEKPNREFATGFTKGEYCIV